MLEKLEDNLDDVLYQLNETSQDRHARTSQYKQYEMFYWEKHGVKPLPASHIIPLITGSSLGPDYETSLSVITDILSRYDKMTAEHKNINVSTPLGDYRQLILAHTLLKLHKIIGHDFFISTSAVPFNSDMPIVLEFSNAQSEVISVQEITFTRHQLIFDRIAAAFELLPLLLTIARPRGGCERRLLKLCINDMRMTFYKENVEWTRKIHFLEFKEQDDDLYFEALLRMDCKQLALDCLQVISLDKLVKLFLAITDTNNIYSNNLDMGVHTLARLFLQVSRNEKVGSLLMMFELSKLILSGTVPITPVQHDAVQFMKSWDVVLGDCVHEWWPYIYFINTDAYDQLMIAKVAADSLVYFLYAYFENRNIRRTKLHTPAKFSRWFKIPVDVRKEIDKVVTSDEVVKFLEEESKRIFMFNIDTDSTVSAVLQRFKKIFD